MSELQMRTMLITSFDNKGIVRFEFIPQGKAANQTNYVEILRRLRGAIRRKRPQLWPNVWILPYDYDPAHKALSSSF
jgi:hypothetical protein